MPYTYPLEDCDVPPERRGLLGAYREFRDRCLRSMEGDTDTSIATQLYGLTWHTAVFRTLMQVGKLQPDRAVNAALFELVTLGYAQIMALGVRRLVDRHAKADSLWNVLCDIERHPELLQRDCFVCFDGLPYDVEAAEQRSMRVVRARGPGPVWMPRDGPTAWVPAETAHRQFDALCGCPGQRKRGDRIEPALIGALKAKLDESVINKVHNAVDRFIAHPERVVAGRAPPELPTHAETAQALKILVRVANAVASRIFGSGTLHSVIAIPQYDVLEALDRPWAETEDLPALQDYWDSVTEAMRTWVYDDSDQLSASGLP